MTIVYITTSLPYGQGESFTVAEIDNLRRLGHKIIVVPVSPRGEVVHVPRAWLGDVKSDRLFSVSNFMATAGRPLWLVTRAWPLIAESRNLRILAKNIAVVPKGIWLAQKALEWNVDHFHANWASCAATVAMVASECSGIPWSFTAHRWDITEDNLLDRKARSASFVRFISADGRNAAASIGALHAHHKGCVVHVGVPLPQGAFRRSETRGDHRSVLLCPASLVPVKGHEFLIQALRVLQDQNVDCELWLAGDGDQKHKLKRQAKDLNVANQIQFLGCLPHQSVMNLYRAGSIKCVVLASRIEGIPVSLMEAMSYQVPVIATHVGGTPELLSDGCGVLVPPADPDALARGIAQILTDRSFRDRVARAGRIRVQTLFSANAIAERLDCLFRGNVVPIPMAETQTNHDPTN